MEHYLFTARSVTHAQRMERALADAGVGARVRRAGNGLTQNGCGYTLQVGASHYARALDALRAAGISPVKVFRVADGERQEVVT